MFYEDSHMSPTIKFKDNMQKVSVKASTHYIYIYIHGKLYEELTLICDFVCEERFRNWNMGYNTELEQPLWKGGNSSDLDRTEN